MEGRETLGLLLILSVALLTGLAIQWLPVRERVRRLLVTGLLLRIAGSLIYLLLVGAYYGGGDYLLYFRRGAELAQSAFEGGAGSVLNLSLWAEGRWWGTEFVSRITGLLFVGTGPTLPGAFITFSLISYVGIVALGLAFQRAYPRIPPERYFRWIVYFPSLWFWPAALGKDAIVLCGVGLATLGFVGRRNHPRWLFMAIGVALVFMIRPQVAATLVFAIVLGQWLGAGLRWTPMRMLQGAMLLAAGVGVVSMSSGALGVELFNPEEVEVYLEGKASVLNQGGSALGVETVDPWLAPINVLFRPFIWEARGVTTMLAALEVLVLWTLAWRRRRDLKAFVRTHRRSRLFWMGIVFVVVYATALGMSLTNVGIIARQRVHILPFIFLLFAGGDATQPQKRERPRVTGSLNVSRPPLERSGV